MAVIYLCHLIMPILPCPRAEPILVIIGPSGTGKSSLVEKLVHDKIVFLQRSHTTRPRRQNEEDTSHIFVSDISFDRLKAQGKFLDMVQPFGLSYRYGMCKLKYSPPLVTVILMRSFVVDLVLKHYPNAVVYQLEVPIEITKQRIQQRGHILGTRLEQYTQEIDLGRDFAKRVFLGDGVEDIYEKVQRAIQTDFNNI